jgi:hypothetical protein
VQIPRLDIKANQSASEMGSMAVSLEGPFAHPVTLVPIATTGNPYINPGGPLEVGKIYKLVSSGEMYPQSTYLLVWD